MQHKIMMMKPHERYFFITWTAVNVIGIQPAGYHFRKTHWRWYAVCIIGPLWGESIIHRFAWASDGNFDISCVVKLNKLFNKQANDRLIETPLHSYDLTPMFHVHAEQLCDWYIADVNVTSRVQSGVEGIVQMCEDHPVDHSLWVNYEVWNEIMYFPSCKKLMLTGL